MPAGESARAEATQLRRRADRLRSEADRWESGAIGEERVAAALDLVDDRAMQALHDRLLNPEMSRTNLDHLVVCLGGVYLVDAKVRDDLS